MSIIQFIRDKASWLVIILVVLSLLGFILMDSSITRGNLFADDANVVGKVEGQPITYVEYQTTYEVAQQRMSQQLGATLNDQQREQASTQTWSTLVQEKIMQNVYDELGIKIHKNELRAIISGDIRLDALANIPIFTNPETRQFEPQRVSQYLRSLQASSKENSQDRASLETFIVELKKIALEQKYLAGFLGSSEMPKWLSAYNEHLKQQKAKASIVEIPYYKAGIDKIEVSGEETLPYMEKYAMLRKPSEARQIQYVVFDASPTPDDSLVLRNSLVSVKRDFATTDNLNEIISKTDANLSYFPNYYVFDKDLQQQMPQNAEIVMALRKNQTVGPFIDGAVSQRNAKNYIMVRMMNKKRIPQQVQIRHILISITQDRNETQAKKTIDSIARAVRSGTDFNTLVSLSDDQGSVSKGGVYDFQYARDFTSLDSAFGKASFYGKMNSKQVIKTNYGYHYLEVLNQQDFQQGYALAILSKLIEPSVATETRVYNEANQFSITAQNKGFTDQAKAKQYELFNSSRIKPNDLPVLPKIQYAKDIVRWTFKYEEKGAISSPVRVNNFYVVAYLDKIFSVEDAVKQEGIDKFGPLVKQQKLAKQMESELKNVTSLDAIAEKYNVNVRSIEATRSEFLVTDSSNTRYVAPSLVGTIFNENKQKTGLILVPVIGNSAIYFVSNIKAEDKPVPTSKPAPSGFDQSYFKQVQMRSVIQNQVISSVIASSDVKDFRYKF